MTARAISPVPWPRGRKEDEMATTTTPVKTAKSKTAATKKPEQAKPKAVFNDFQPVKRPPTKAAVAEKLQETEKQLAEARAARDAAFSSKAEYAGKTAKLQTEVERLNAELAHKDSDLQVVRKDRDDLKQQVIKLRDAEGDAREVIRTKDVRLKDLGIRDERQVATIAEAREALATANSKLAAVERDLAKVPAWVRSFLAIFG